MSSSKSQSDSSQSQIQDTQDNRIAAAEGAVSLVANRSSVGGNVTMTTTDFNSVGRSFDFAERLAKGAADTAAASAAQTQSVATSAMQSVQAAYKDVNDNLGAAYETAKAGEQKVLVGVGLIIVGFVAIKMVGGRA